MLFDKRFVQKVNAYSLQELEEKRRQQARPVNELHSNSNNTLCKGQRLTHGAYSLIMQTCPALLTTALL